MKIYVVTLEKFEKGNTETVGCFRTYKEAKRCALSQESFEDDHRTTGVWSLSFNSDTSNIGEEVIANEAYISTRWWQDGNDFVTIETFKI